MITLHGLLFCLAAEITVRCPGGQVVVAKDRATAAETGLCWIKVFAGGRASRAIHAWNLFTIQRFFGQRFLNGGKLAADALALGLYGALGAHAFFDIGRAEADLRTHRLIHFDFTSSRMNPPSVAFHSDWIFLDLSQSSALPEMVDFGSERGPGVFEAAGIPC